MLCPTITASPMNSRNDGSAWSIVGALITIASVIPVSTVMNGGMATPGSTRVWNLPASSPPTYLTAPISVISQSAAVAPVVSRSRMQNGTAWSGAPISSNFRCPASIGPPGIDGTPNRCSVQR